jgi:hypothetical protein
MAFMFRLENEDGTPAEPPIFKTPVPNWQAGDRIPLGRGRSLRVLETLLRENEDGEPVPVLVIELT